VAVFSALGEFNKEPEPGFFVLALQRPFIQPDNAAQKRARGWVGKIAEGSEVGRSKFDLW
jgi:hypothetical protein